MKKTYQAPEMAVEFFAMTQSIASCDTKIGLLNSQCVIGDENSTDNMKDFAYMGWFLSGSCKESAENMDGYDGICYHTNANSAFNS